MSPNHSMLTDFAYTEILNMILSSEFEPGERIREDVLAERLGISRTPVREAVNRLSQNGFVTNVKRKGIYCIKVTRKDLLDLLDLRIALESLSFEKCIEAVTDEQLDAFQQIITEFHKRCNNIIRNGGGMSRELLMLHNDYDVRFHISIAEVSNSSRLIQYIREVETMLLIARQRIYTSDSGSNIVLLSWKQHELMLDCFRSKDIIAAKELLQQHLSLMRDTQVNVDD